MTNITHVSPVNEANEPSAVVIPRNHFIILGAMDERPAASLALRKAIYYVEGAAGISDQISVCRKNAADESEWIEVNDTFQVPLEDSITLTDLDNTGVDVGSYVPVDLTDYTESRLGVVVTVAGDTGQLELRYQDSASTIADLGPVVSLGSTGVKLSDWEPIPAGALQPVTVYAAAFGGNASEDPAVFAVVAHFRR